MFFKKNPRTLEKIKEEIYPLIKQNKYFSAGEIARENGYKELAEQMYEISRANLRERIKRELKYETTIPSEKCKKDLLNFNYKRIIFNPCLYSRKN
jgi:hypothetical protein